MIIKKDMSDRLDNLVAILNVWQEARHITSGYTFKPDIWEWIASGNKWVKINCGSSGVFLMDVNNGELYNIKGYGVPDQNKKKKADIGNIYTVDPAVLFTKRYNYLR